MAKVRNPWDPVTPHNQPPATKAIAVAAAAKKAADARDKAARAALGLGPNPSLAQVAAAKKAAAAAKASSGNPGPMTPRPGSTLTSPGASTVKVAGLPIGQLNVAGIRSFLISKGYQLPQSNDSNIGKALAGALNDYGLHNIPAKFGSTGTLVKVMQSKGWKADGSSGQQKPSVYNGMVGKAGVGANTAFTTGGNVIPNANGTSPSYDASALTSAANATGNVPINESLASGGAQLLDANKLSAAMAGQEFDPQINTAQHLLDMNKPQTNQDLHDIASWYDQALSSLGTATTRDAAATKSGQDSITAADQAIIGSLGGDASAGASTVGAQAAADQGTLAALGTSQDQYNQDLAPIMQGSRAGALSTERAAGSSRAASLAMALANAQSGKAGSVASHILDITGINNTTRDNTANRLLQIKQINEALNQQAFANTQSAEATKIAAITAGANLVNAQNKPVKGSFADTSPMSRQSLAQNIYNVLAANPKLTPSQAQSLVTAHVSAAGWSMADPQVASWAQSVYSNGYQPQG